MKIKLSERMERNKKNFNKLLKINYKEHNSHTIKMVWLAVCKREQNVNETMDTFAPNS